MNHPKSMFQLSGVHYRVHGLTAKVKGSLQVRVLKGIRNRSISFVHGLHKGTMLQSYYM